MILTKEQFSEERAAGGKAHKIVQLSRAVAEVKVYYYPET